VEITAFCCTFRWVLSHSSDESCGHIGFRS